MSERLAINGGNSLVPEGIEKPWPIITQDDIDAVTGVLKRGELWGPEATEKTALEKEWAEYCGVKHCIVTNSGTSAMHACVAGVGVETGDEVIVPAFTFWATAQAVLCQNAIPVFVDIEPVGYNIDPAKIEEKITDRTKAIIVVHAHGLPCDMDEINAVAKKHGLKVLEDAAHSHGCPECPVCRRCAGHGVALISRARAEHFSKARCLRKGLPVELRPRPSGDQI